MRIAVLTNDYPPNSGGAGRIAEQQVKMSERDGHEVRVFCHAVRWLKNIGPIRLMGHIQDLWPNARLIVEIKEWKPDVLITHNLTGCGFATPKKIQAKWIHVLHDVQLFEPSGQVRDAQSVTLWQRAWSVLRQQALGRPVLILSPTQWLLDEHRRRGFFRLSSLSVLPNPAPLIEQADRQPHNPVRLLFVGRVSEDKGAHLLKQLLTSLGIPFELHIVGEGIELSKWRSPSTVIHGTLPPPIVREQMKECDILLVPSQIAENQPTVILEAASVGLPVIASDVGGVKETLNGAGTLVAPSDVEAWGRAIKEIIKNYQDASRRMYILAREHDPEQHAQRFLSLVKSNL